MRIDVAEQTATIIYRFWGRELTVDRQTGVFYPYKDSTLDPQRINGEPFAYLKVLADKAEGKETEYTPKQHAPQVCEDIYERALKAEMIKVVRGEDGVVFEYPRFPDLLVFYSYGKMDLDAGHVLVEEDRVKPINPSFRDFLKNKKAELEREN